MANSSVYAMERPAEAWDRLVAVGRAAETVPLRAVLGRHDDETALDRVACLCWDDVLEPRKAG
jgi:hypothetical protein